MANFRVSPQALVFGKVQVSGPLTTLFSQDATQAFTLYNNSGASITLTNYGFSSSTEGDAVTQPAGPWSNSDFTVVPTGSAFPITIASGANHGFTVTYKPLRRGSGFGDVRSQLLALFTGNVPLTNGGQITNSSGEVINYSVPVPVIVGVGGGVIESGYDWPSTHPIYWSAGKVTAGDSGVANNVQGMTPNMTIADLDTMGHQSVMLFFSAPVSSNQSETSYRPPVVGSTGNWIWNGTAAVYEPGVSYDPGSPKGGRGYQVLVFFADDTVTMNITIKAITSAAHVVVAQFNGVTFSNAGGLFIGNQEGLDLQGLELTCTTTSVAGSTAYNIGCVRTY